MYKTVPYYSGTITCQIDWYNKG